MFTNKLHKIIEDQQQTIDRLNAECSEHSDAFFKVVDHVMNMDNKKFDLHKLDVFIENKLSSVLTDTSWIAGYRQCYKDICEFINAKESNEL